MVAVLFAKLVKNGYLYRSKTLKVKLIKPQEMNTNTSLKSIIPTINGIIRRADLNIGYNEFYFDQDGWNISFDFALNVGVFGSNGSVFNLTVEHYDEDRDEETVFCDDEILKFREELESILRDLA